MSAARTCDTYDRVARFVPNCSLVVERDRQGAKKPCVYLLIDGDTVAYVGKTRDLLDRLRCHRRSKRFQSVIIVSASTSATDPRDVDDLLYGLEGVVAREFAPSQNVKAYQVPQPIWSAWSRRLGFLRSAIGPML